MMFSAPILFNRANRLLHNFLAVALLVSFSKAENSGNKW